MSQNKKPDQPEFCYNEPMAMVKTDGTITELEGKEGGQIWRYDQCKQHLQAYPRIIDKEGSPQQWMRRRAFIRLMSYIPRHATVEFVHRWSLYAYHHPKITKKGKVTILTWHCAFLSYNINRVIEGQPITEFPPE